MSSDYSILFKSDKSIEIVKDQLGNLINSPFTIREDWDYEDLYQTKILGLWIQLEDAREGLKRFGGDHSRYSYEIDIEYLRDLISSENGKELVQIVSVELARMITKKMKCNSVVLRDDVITHKFTVE